MTPSGATDPAGRLAELEAAVRDLSARVTALEEAPRPAAAVRDSRPPRASGESRPAGPKLGFGQGFGLVGRAVLFLAGAFLLRALTDGGMLPPRAGFGLGLAYGLLLVFLAGRSGTRGDRAGAVATGLAALLIAFPFVYETTAVRQLVSPLAGAAALAVLAAAGLTLAVRDRLRIIYWSFGLAALITLTALHYATGAAILFASLILALGAATTAVSYARRWYLLRWPAALVADFVILHLAVTATNPQGARIAGQAVSGSAIQVLTVALVAVYLGIFTFRALVQGQGVRTFDVIQSALAIAVGYGAGSRLAVHLDRGVALLGWAALATALVGYGVAFVFVRTRRGRGRAFFYFATLALLFLILGSRHVVPSGLLAWAWIVLGVAAAWLGGRFRRSTLRAHSVVYLGLAFLQTGMFAAAGDAFLADPGSTWTGVGIPSVVALAAAAACYVLLMRSRDPSAPRVRRIPRFLVGVMALAGIGWLLVTLLVRLVAGPPPDATPAAVAVVRTAVLAVTAVVLARASRHAAYAELAWLVYPILVWGIGKLILEDLKAGDPVALTVSFALFGGALILAPRFLRKRVPDPPPGEA